VWDEVTASREITQMNTADTRATQKSLAPGETVMLERPEGRRAKYEVSYDGPFEVVAGEEPEGGPKALIKDAEGEKRYAHPRHLKRVRFADELTETELESFENLPSLSHAHETSKVSLRKPSRETEKVTPGPSAEETEEEENKGQTSTTEEAHTPEGERTEDSKTEKPLQGEESIPIVEDWDQVAKVINRRRERNGDWLYAVESKQ
jgi:hypothetical protein